MFLNPSFPAQVEVGHRGPLAEARAWQSCCQCQSPQEADLLGEEQGPPGGPVLTSGPHGSQASLCPEVCGPGGVWVRTAALLRAAVVPVCMLFTGGPERCVCSNLRLLGCPQEGRAAAGLAPGWGLLAVRARGDVGATLREGLRAAVGRRDRATLPRALWSRHKLTVRPAPAAYVFI